LEKEIVTFEWHTCTIKSANRTPIFCQREREREKTKKTAIKICTGSLTDYSSSHEQELTKQSRPFLIQTTLTVNSLISHSGVLTHQNTLRDEVTVQRERERAKRLLL